MLELCAFAALGYWGYDSAGWWLAALAPLAAIVVWGTFVAPKARAPLSPARRLAVELVVFAAAVAGLAAAGATVAAIVLAAVYAVNRTLLAVSG